MSKVFSCQYCGRIIKWMSLGRRSVVFCDRSCKRLWVAFTGKDADENMDGFTDRPPNGGEGGDRHDLPGMFA